MSTVWVSSTGFQKKTLTEIKVELETEFQNIFGSGIDLDPTGPIGQIIGLLSKREADLWDGAQEIYTSRNPQEASGTSLDFIASENGLTRLDATKTRVENVLLYGDEGTVLTAGRKVRQENNTELLYELDTNITIEKANARFIAIEPDDPGGAGEDFTVTLNGTLYTYTTSGGDGKTEVVDGLIALIEAGSFLGSVNNNDDVLDILDVDTDFSVSFTSNLTENSLASGGDFTADTEGSNTLPANTLTVIVTSVAGWDSVNNPEAGTTGRDQETDAEFRIRRETAFLRGNATEDAIRTALVQDVEDVSAASVKSNRTLATDIDGRPPKSFEAVVQGGTDLEVAEKIWKVQPAGIQSYGNVSQNITDSEGTTQEIQFSRPTEVYIWVKVQRDFNTEEDYPSNGDDLIKQAIVDWSLDITNIDVGVDVIRQRLTIPVYTVAGVGDIDITIDDTPNPGDTPTYAEQNITISPREIAAFALSRIIVEDLP
jgi:uncharacterized phage protein gp47/JayE